MRRAAAVAAGVVVAVGILVAMVLAFASRDDSPVQALGGPGEALPDQCAAHERPGSVRYNADPPASGPHLARVPKREQLTSDDELLEALELGDVVIVYPTRAAPPALRRLRDGLTGPFAPGLAAAGQAVILTRDPSVAQITALAWRHRLRAASAADPRLREFAEFWVGRGYAQAHGSNCPARG